jgi:hypothetical protein
LCGDSGRRGKGRADERLRPNGRSTEANTLAEAEGGEEGDGSANPLVGLVLVDFEGVSGEVGDPFDDVRPVHVAVAGGAVVADAGDVMEVGADGAAAVGVEPGTFVDEAEAVEDFGVAGVVPVAGLVGDEAVEELFVLVDVGDLVEVITIFEADSDAVGLSCANKLDQGFARGGDRAPSSRCVW